MVGTRFILNSRYFHIAKPGEKLSDHALSGEHAANLVRYCGTRETVDKNIDMADDLPITFKQKVSVKDLLNLCTEKGLSAECEEYKAYEANPTRANASSLMLHLANKLSENTSLNLSEQNIVNEAIRLAQFYDVKNRPATKKQEETIKEFLEQLNYKDDEDKPLEYTDYINNPTMSNASDLISRLAEELLFNEAGNLIEYTAKRPGAYKVGEHGLFSSYPDVDLDRVAEEVSTHDGNIWTDILSLRREDADRLGYDCQKPWKDLIMSKVDLIAEAHGININNLQWYAGMHNTGHHPHVHLFVYSTDPKEGFLSKKNIKNLKSEFVNEIFKDERQEIYINKDKYLNELISQSKALLNNLLSEPNQYISDETLKYLVNQMLTLSSKDFSKGRNTYGFSSPDKKKLVDDILTTLVSNNNQLSNLYDKWCDESYSLSKYYSKKEFVKPDISKIDKFTSIKNYILECAKSMNQSGTFITATDDITISPPPNITAPAETEPQSADNDNGFIDDTKPEEYEYTELQKIPSFILGNEGKEVIDFKKAYQNSSDLQTRTAQSCRKLADCYYYGKGTEKDYNAAQMWYGIAADSYGDSMSAYKLGQMYLYGTKDTEINKELGNYYCKTAFIQFRDGLKNRNYFYELENDSDNLHYYSEVDSYETYIEYLLGRMYLKGEGVEQDYRCSSNVFSLAAKNGYSHAYYYLGNQFYYGLGFTQDYEKAFDYYLKADRKGDKYAAYRLGKMYLSGEGVNIDIQQAEHYFSKATKTVVLANYDLAKLYEDYADDFNNVSKDYINGLYKKALEGMIEQEENDIQNAFTEMRIANMYLAGKGTDINVNSAIEWLNKAAKQDNPNAAYQLGYIYSSEKYNIIDEQKANENYKRACLEYEKAEEENSNVTAESRLGKMYLNGYGVEKDIQKAVIWLKKATLNGSASSAYTLAKLCENGDGIEKNIEEAYSYYQISAVLGNFYANYQVGKISLQKGEIEKAVENFQEAAKGNISHAWFKLGKIYSDESYGLYDISKAQLCYSNALNLYITDYTQNPDDFTAYRLGKMYFNGLGTDIDINKAIHWFSQAEKLGNTNAAYQLGKIAFENNDIENAIKHFQYAAQGNISNAWFNLAKIHSNESYGHYDIAKAQLCYSNALNLYITDYKQNPNDYIAYRLGNMYLKGLGTDMNINQAIYWFSEAEKFENANAAYQLGYIYHSEKYGLQNNELASNYFRKALSAYLIRFNNNQTDSELALRIGTFYQYGLGIERDIEKALLWYKKAVELGNIKAQQKIDETNTQQQITVLNLASIAAHMGKIINTETIAAAKQKYTSDSKQLRDEKIQKIQLGHAVSDNPISYDY